MKPAIIIKRLDFLNIKNLNPKAQDDYLNIRNEPDVRKNMYADHVISRDEHRIWLDSLKTDSTKKFYAIFFDDKLIGGVGLNSINLHHKRADWAFFVSNSVAGKGLGSSIEFKFLDLAFSCGDLEKLNCEVIMHNALVIKLHKRFGFIEEGIRRNHVLRDGQFFDSVFLGITNDEWRAARKTLINGAFSGVST